MDESESSKKSFLYRQLDLIRFGLVFQSIRFKLKKHGIEFTPYYLMQEGLQLVTNIPEIIGIPDEYSFEFLEPEDMKVGEENGGITEEKAVHLLNTGQKCLGLKHKGDVAAYLWINLNEIDFLSIENPLEE